MRISDFLGRYLDGISRVVERHSGSLSLEAYLALPEGVTHERSRQPARTDRDAGSDVLLLGLLGPDPDQYGREEDAEPAEPRLYVDPASPDDTTQWQPADTLTDPPDS